MLQFQRELHVIAQSENVFFRSRFSAVISAITFFPGAPGLVFGGQLDDPAVLTAFMLAAINRLGRSQELLPPLVDLRGRDTLAAADLRQLLVGLQCLQYQLELLVGGLSSTTLRFAHHGSSTRQCSPPHPEGIEGRRGSLRGNLGTMVLPSSLPANRTLSETPECLTCHETLQFNQAKGFGFITPSNGGGDVFVHQSEIQGSKGLREGDRVEFEVAHEAKGPKATNVRVIEG